MAFVEQLLHKSERERKAILDHPFVRGIGNGTLPVRKFRYYVRQDYVYLIEYARVLALASVRATDLDSMGWFARLLDGTLNTEMALHRGYCARFGITERTLKATRPSPTTIGYTSYLLAIGYGGSFSELTSSLLPCQHGYWEIGDHFARQGEPGSQPLYCEWIRMYSAQEFRKLAEELVRIVNRLAAPAGAAERRRMEQAYMTSLRWEHLFWNAAYNEEGWPA